MMGAIASARPGDHILLEDGTYDNTVWLNSHSAKNMLVREIEGTATAPILIAAETIGGVEIRGAGGFRFVDVAHLIVRGFKFTHSQDNSAYSDDTAVQCDDCRHVRFTRNHFELTTSANGSSDWLSISSGQSDHNRMDHNVFKNKGTEGVFVLIFGKHTLMDHNYFHNQFYSAGNGGECVRIGNSELGNVMYYSTVEYNLFEKCNGDMEAVSVKSSGNTFKANTFRGNEGSLTFRHGNDNSADGNFFLAGENGLRSYGHDHMITNNYFGSLTGSGSLTPLVIGSGTIDVDLARSNSEHSRSRNVLVAFNTFYNNQGAYLRVGEDFRPLNPVNITVAHNILVGNAGTMINFDEGENITWTKNILFGSANRGNAPANGYVSVNPQLIARPDGTFGIGSTSPAIDQAGVSAYSFLKLDMDGQDRTGLKDSGSDEFSSSARTVRPLGLSDVGPSAI
jgi:poly(beta-D-mannuronate) lyase